MDSATVSARRARLHAMFPGLARIGDVNGNNYAHIEPADLRSGAEKRFGFQIGRIGRA